MDRLVLDQIDSEQCACRGGYTTKVNGEPKYGISVTGWLKVGILGIAEFVVLYKGVADIKVGSRLPSNASAVLSGIIPVAELGLVGVVVNRYLRPQQLCLTREAVVVKMSRGAMILFDDCIVPVGSGPLCA